MSRKKKRRSGAKDPFSLGVKATPQLEQEINRTLAAEYEDKPLSGVFARTPPTEEEIKAAQRKSDEQLTDAMDKMEEIQKENHANARRY